MPGRDTVELKTFVPARDFALSQQFYVDSGFTRRWGNDHLVYFHHGPCAFLLQNDFLAIVAENFVMHLRVEDVDAWYQHIDAANLVDRYGVRLSPVESRPWGMRDFTLTDPGGVVWRIAQHTDGPPVAA